MTPPRASAFAAAALPVALFNVPLASYLPPFYAEELGISLGTIGVILVAARVWDVVSDVLMGTLTDRTRSRWGRRRPWLVASLPLLVASVWALFFPPATAGAAWLLLSLVAATAAVTMLSIAHTAWSAEISADPHDRTRIQGAIVMVTIAGSLMAMLVPAALEGRVEDPVAMRVEVLGWLAIALAVPAVGLTLLAGPREGGGGDREADSRPLPVVRAAFARQPALRALLAADFMQGVGSGVGAALVYYVALAKGLPERTSLLLTCAYIVGIFAVPVWVRMSRRLGKYRTIRLASLYSMFAVLLIPAVPAGNLGLLLAAFGMVGLSVGVWLFLMKSVVSDCVEVEERACSAPRAGILLSLFVLTQKIGGAVGVGMSFLVLDAVGYVSGEPMSRLQSGSVLATLVGGAILGHGTSLWAASRNDRRGSPHGS